MAGTTIAATVLSVLVSASYLFSVTRQSVPIEAKDEMRVAKDERYFRIF
jgi:hypothetical protein